MDFKLLLKEKIIVGVFFTFVLVSGITLYLSLFSNESLGIIYWIDLILFILLFILFINRILKGKTLDK